MKKILLGMLIILLLTILAVILMNSLPVGNYKVESISDIKDASMKLTSSYNNAVDVTNMVYPNKIANLGEKIGRLADVKEEYDNKTRSIKGDKNLNLGLLKKYQISFLWKTVGQYATNNGLVLQLDIRGTTTTDVYDLEFSVIGNYVGITDFISDVENDSNLKFIIEDFRLAPQGMLTKGIATPEESTGASSAIDKIKENDMGTQVEAQVAATTGESQKEESKIINLNVLEAMFTVKNIGVTLK